MGRREYYTRDEMRELNEDQLRSLGLGSHVYIRFGMFNGRLMWVIYAASGEEMIGIECYEVACMAAWEEGLTVLPVH